MCFSLVITPLPLEIINILTVTIIVSFLFSLFCYLYVHVYIISFVLSVFERNVNAVIQNVLLDLCVSFSIICVGFTHVVVDSFLVVCIYPQCEYTSLPVHPLTGSWGTCIRSSRL